MLAGVDPDSPAVTEEIFGPVLTIQEFETEEEAVSLANRSAYGLCAGVFTRDLSRAVRMSRALEAGTIWVNRYGRSSDHILPTGGFKASGLGKDLGRQAYRDNRRTKSVLVDHIDRRTANTDDRKKAFDIALIPGDGIGVEVTDAAWRVAEAAAAREGRRSGPRPIPGRASSTSTPGAMMPEDGIDTLRRHDAILLGAVGWPATVPDSVSLHGLLLPIRKSFDQYANVRPHRLLPGVEGPLKTAEFDILCIRENTEGEYAGAGGRVHQGTPERGRGRDGNLHAGRGRAHPPLRIRAGEGAAVAGSPR